MASDTKQLQAVLAAAERGDHGTAQDAIDFILDSPEPWSASEFLPRWREGNLDEWPEFYEFLAKRTPAPSMKQESER